MIAPNEFCPLLPYRRALHWNGTHSTRGLLHGRRTNCACTPCRSLNSVRILLSGRTVLFTLCVKHVLWILWSCLQLCRGCRFWSGWMDGRLAQVTFNDSWNCIHATSTTDSTAKVVARGGDMTLCVSQHRLVYIEVDR